VAQDIQHTRLLFTLVRLFDVRLGGERVPTGYAKARIIAAVERSRRRIPLTLALRVLGLSASRYQAWLRLDQSCSLDDRSSCPRTVPTQLTSHEIATIHQMVTAEEYRHVSLGSSTACSRRSRSRSRIRSSRRGGAVSEITGFI